MTGNEVSFVQKVLEIVVKITVGAPHVGKGSRAPSPGWRKLMGK